MVKYKAYANQFGAAMMIGTRYAPIRAGLLSHGPITTFWHKNADVRAILPFILKTSYNQSFSRREVFKVFGEKRRRTFWPQVTTYQLAKFGDGGYPLAYITADCDALCAKCATMQVTHRNLDWPRIVAVEANYEDPDLYCGHCSEHIEAAYVD